MDRVDDRQRATPWRDLKVRFGSFATAVTTISRTAAGVIHIQPLGVRPRLLRGPALTFNAYHLGGPGQGPREELDEHSQRRSGPEEWRPDPCSFRRHGRRSLAPDARQPGPVGAGHRRRRTSRYRDPG